MKNVYFSFLCNCIIFIWFTVTMGFHARRVLKENNLKEYLTTYRFFTTDSNLLVAFASLLMAIGELGVLCGICEAVPVWILMIKFMGTAAVTLTFLTVVLFLGPTQGGWKQFYIHDGFYLHFAGPIVAVVSFLVWEKPLPAVPGIVWIGCIPVLIYGALYLYNVVLKKDVEHRWPDFYGFNYKGKWPFFMLGVYIVGYLISMCLVGV